MLQFCSKNSTAADSTSSPGPEDDYAADCLTESERAELLARPIVCDGCDAKVTLANVTGRGQLYAHIERLHVAELSGLPLFGPRFYVNLVRFPLPPSATIIRPSFTDNVYEFGNACESCCARIEARADAASLSAKSFVAFTSRALFSCGWPRPLVYLVLVYSCVVRCPSDQCSALSCLAT